MLKSKPKNQVKKFDQRDQCFKVAYENIQGEATSASRGLKIISLA